MTLKTKIDNDLNEALKAKNALKVSTLRLVKSAIKNKEIDAKGELKEDQVLQILSTMIKQRKESIEQFEIGGRNDLAEKEKGEIVFIEAYLPQQLSEAELTSLVQEAIASVGAKGPQDMGKVMKALMPRVTGKADGKFLSELVRKKLV